MSYRGPIWLEDQATLPGAVRFTGEFGVHEKAFMMRLRKYLREKVSMGMVKRIELRAFHITSPAIGVKLVSVPVRMWEQVLRPGVYDIVKVDQFNTSPVIGGRVNVYIWVEANQ